MSIQTPSWAELCQAFLDASAARMRYGIVAVAFVEETGEITYRTFSHADGVANGDILLATGGMVAAATQFAENTASELAGAYGQKGVTTEALMAEIKRIASAALSDQANATGSSIVQIKPPEDDDGEPPPKPPHTRRF